MPEHALIVAEPAVDRCPKRHWHIWSARQRGWIATGHNAHTPRLDLARSYTRTEALAVIAAPNSDWSYVGLPPLTAVHVCDVVIGSASDGRNVH